MSASAASRRQNIWPVLPRRRVKIRAAHPVRVLEDGQLLCQRVEDAVRRAEGALVELKQTVVGTQAPFNRTARRSLFLRALDSLSLTKTSSLAPVLSSCLPPLDERHRRGGGGGGSLLVCLVEVRCSEQRLPSPADAVALQELSGRGPAQDLDDDIVGDMIEEVGTMDN